MKKVLSMLLALVMVLVLMPVGVINVSAAEADFTFSIYDGKVTVTDYTGSGGAVVTPSTFRGYPVTSIGNYAFMYCDSLTSVTIPNSVTSIGNWAFSRCGSLTSLTIPDSVTSIGSCAFSRCDSLTSVTIPNSVTSIGGGAFEYCDSLTSVTIPNSVTSIGEAAFCNCTSLTSVTIPDSVTSIGNSAFCNCTSLTSVTIPDSVTSIGASAFSGCDSLTSVTIPNSVTSIGGGAFRGCTSLTLVTIPNSVKTIGPDAFSGCTSLTSVTIPNSVTSLGLVMDYGGGVFSGCTSLTSVTIGSGVGQRSQSGIKPRGSSIKVSTFSNCTNLKSVTVYSTDCSFDRDCGLNYNHTIYGFVGSTAQAFANSIGATFVDVETVHTHTWQAATCTEAKTCKVCGKTSGKALGHKYTNNCDTSCNVCSATRKITHSYTPATCTKAATCKVCGVTNGNKLGHKYTNNCDSTCNTCGATRKITHTYKTTTTKATLKKDGSVVKKCTVCGDEASKTIIKKIKSINLSDIAYTYNGKAKKPSVIVKDSAGKKISSKYYTVTYAKGRKNVGTYKVTIKFKGNYSGQKTLTFKINPPKTTVKKLTAAKKSLKVGITKKTTQVTGYEVQYSTSKKFTKAATKTKTVKSAKTTSLTLKSLKAKKTYYVRVRTYKKVGKTTYYSGWSTYKSKKTK